MEFYLDHHLDYECLEEPCVDVFPEMSFIEEDNYRRDLKFSAFRVNMHETSIEFISPRINNRVISPTTMRCTEYKRNFFGYEVCQNWTTVDMSHALCSQLGLGQTDGIARSEYTSFRSTRYPILYKYSETRELWNTIRIGSYLAPATNYTGIQILRCSL
ncbi:MAG: hypothetical protein CME65_02975 [Halobacteriovoraceae bacterium]|nr:hypothetical protein [Halobacteriovoraceae bacterium]